MVLELLTYNLLSNFTNGVIRLPLEKTSTMPNIDVDYFQFYNAVSSVYSSKIEGDEIDFDSFYKHKFLKIDYKVDYTKKADDLFNTYEFIESNTLNFDNVKKAHAILSNNLLPENHRGVIRSNPMFVINSDDRIEYVAAKPEDVHNEINKLFEDIGYLLNQDLSKYEAFYFASFIHLVFVKIHPFQDGNGRMARLIEKWFLIEVLGEKAKSIQLEKNYFLKLDTYYSNLKKLGIDYENLDYNKSLDFLLMTINMDL